MDSHGDDVAGAPGDGVAAGEEAPHRLDELPDLGLHRGGGRGSDLEEGEESKHGGGGGGRGDGGSSGGCESGGWEWIWVQVLSRVAWVLYCLFDSLLLLLLLRR